MYLHDPSASTRRPAATQEPAMRHWHHLLYETRHADNTKKMHEQPGALVHASGKETVAPLTPARRPWATRGAVEVGPGTPAASEQALYRKVPHCPWEVVKCVGASLGLVLTVWSTCRLRHDPSRPRSRPVRSAHLDGRRIREAHSYHRLSCVISCSADVGRRLRLS